jgi:hypothetical protein
MNFGFHEFLPLKVHYLSMLFGHDRIAAVIINQYELII